MGRAKQAVGGKVAQIKVSAITALFLVPTVASAGVLSFVSGIFTGPEAEPQAARENSQNIELLQAAVNPSFTSTFGGADLMIVDGEALVSEASPASVEDRDTPARGSGQVSMYVVRPGDSLSQIAKMFGVSENTILWTNDLKSKTVKEGQVLVILPINGVRHTVKDGDTIEKIAKAYKGDAQEVRDFNGLEEGAKLAVGSVVIVPNGELSAPEPAKKAARPGSSVRIAAGSVPEAAPSGGWLIRPVSGGVKTQGIHGYNGIDIGLPVGSTVFAAASGQVVVSKGTGWNGGYGGYVVIAHDNGVQTLYSHLSGAIVPVGQRVVQGQVIGYSGNSGKSTGPHLHFEVRGARNPF